MPHCICINQRNHFLYMKSSFPCSNRHLGCKKSRSGRWKMIQKSPGKKKKKEYPWVDPTQRHSKNPHTKTFHSQCCMVLEIFTADQNASILFYIASAYLKIKFKSKDSSNYSPYARLNIFIPFFFYKFQYVCLIV